MAKQSVNIGSVANDGTGDTLRAAYDKLNDNDTEIYSLLGNGTTLSITGDASVSAGAVTIADDAITAAKLANSINTEIAANTAKVTNATHTGDVTGATALTIATDAVTTAKLANDGVTHDKLENRYTASSTITATSGARTVDWDDATVFKMQSALTGDISYSFRFFKVGQVITIHNLTGAFAITLNANFNTPTFNKLGAQDYDGSKTNALMIECIDDSANAIFNYSILTYTSDPTP